MNKHNPKTMKKRDKKGLEQELINFLQLRIKSLEIERQLYEQNPNLMKNLKMMNIALIQSDIESLKNKLYKILNSELVGHNITNSHP